MLSYWRSPWSCAAASQTFTLKSLSQTTRSVVWLRSPWGLTTGTTHLSDVPTPRWSTASVRTQQEDVGSHRKVSTAEVGCSVQQRLAAQCSWGWLLSAAEVGCSVQLRLAAQCSWGWLLSAAEVGCSVQLRLAAQCSWGWLLSAKVQPVLVLAK